MNRDLNTLSSEELGRLFPVIISDYDPAWKDFFMAEKEVIIKVLGKENIVNLEHIGSTAVPGLKAKPTIDILIEITENTDTGMIIKAMESACYHFIPKPENPPPYMMFAKGYAEKGFSGQAYHVHVRYKGDWDEPCFRDYLIKHPSAAREYEQLKLRLADQFPNDREKYTEAKTGFISKMNVRARKELKR